MARVLIAAELQELLDPDPVPGHEVRWIPVAEPTPAGDFPAVVPLLTRRFGEAELAVLPKLRIVANCAVGYENIDLAAAAARGVTVTNTPDVLTGATADLAWALILGATRRLKEGMALLAEGRWTGWDPRQLLGFEVGGKTLGIVGAGRIGQAVGRRATVFGMRILYADSKARADFERATGARRVPLEQLLAASDVVTLHVPSNAQTRGLIDRAAFAGMKPGAYLINTARGDIVDESALLEALADGRLGGAGLDVFPREPEVHEALVRDPRVVTLPHLGSATTDTRRAMADLAVRNVRAVLAGEAPLTPVGS